ncbi:hypothetical protein J9Z47_003543 [Salmonella enterica]|nr:hypothetical protein [Salmonella enterica]
MAEMSKVQIALLERKVARWVWNEHRSVTAAEIAGEFSVSIYSARILIQRLMRRADGLQCRLETSPGINSAGHTGIVKYFSVLSLPDSYQPATKNRK